MKHKYIKTHLECYYCGSVVPIWRFENRQRKLHHVKHLYCWKCQKTTPHIELKEWGLFEKELLEREEYDNNQGT